MPNSVRTSYSVSWQENSDEDQFGDMDALVSAFSKGTAATGIVDTVVEGAKPLIANVLSKRLKGQEYIQRTGRTTKSNAKQEQLFRQVNFREFEFNYSFSPKSETEAANVLNIIRLFRYHMLPEYKDPTSFMYIYPSEFQVKYYVGAEENQYVEKLLTAVLTNMVVDYTPNGQYNTFANGMPQQINMTLSFKELAVPTKETSPYDSLGV
jgi:hypothetical protein